MAKSSQFIAFPLSRVELGGALHARPRRCNCCLQRLAGQAGGPMWTKIEVSAAVRTQFHALLRLEHFARQSPYLPAAVARHLEAEAENASEHSPAPRSPCPILLDRSRAGAGAALVRWRRLAHDARRLRGLPGSRRERLPRRHRDADPPGPADRARQCRLQGARCRRMAARQHRRHHRPRGRPRHRRGARGVELVQAVVVACLARAGRGACHHRRRAGLPLRGHEEGHRNLGNGPRQGDRQAHRARGPRYGRSGHAMHAGLSRSPLRHHRRPHRRRRRRPGVQHRPGQGRGTCVDWPGGHGRRRRHRRHGGAGGAPAARQHGLASWPATGRLDPQPPGVGGGERRRHRPHCQGHLGFPARRAAHRRRGDEGQGDQGKGARRARQIDRRADRRWSQGDCRQDRRARGGDLARVPPRPRQGRGAGRAAGRLQALSRDREGRGHAAARRDRRSRCWRARASPAC